jgi:hypothetical protein
MHGMQEVIGSTPLSSTQPHQGFLMRFFYWPNRIFRYLTTLSCAAKIKVSIVVVITTK